MLVEDLLGGGNAVHDGHLDVHDAQVGLVLLDEAHGLLAVGGLGDDLVSRLGEGLDNVEADERLVLCDDDAATAGGGGLRGRGLFAHDSHISMLRADALAVAAPP